MKLSFSLLVVGIVLVFSAVSCGKGMEGSKEKSPAAEGEAAEAAGAVESGSPAVAGKVPAPASPGEDALKQELAETTAGLVKAERAAEQAEKAVLEATREALQAEKRVLDAEKKATKYQGKAAEFEASFRGCSENAAAAGGGGGQVVGQLKRLCDEMDGIARVPALETEGWQAWKDKLAVTVKDFRLYSPQFRQWRLQAVGSESKTSVVRHSGTFFGFGLVVELENRSDDVLLREGVIVRTTYLPGNDFRVCYAESNSSRTWDPMANKGKGGWVKEKQASEKPFRPQERKRYSVQATECIEPQFIENGIESIRVEVYFRFVTAEGKAVVAGPLKTLERPGQLLWGLAVGPASKAQKRKRRSGLEDVQAFYLLADRVYATGAGRPGWVALDQLEGVTPEAFPAHESLPDRVAALSKVYGALTLSLTEPALQNPRDVGRAAGLGHRLLSFAVGISIDKSNVESQLETAVREARAGQAAARAVVSEKVNAVAAGKAEFAAASNKAAESVAKAKIKTAAVELKAARKAVLAANRAVKAAKKATTGGVGAFLKAQAQILDCGSFVLDVGRATLKPLKGSMDRKQCQALLRGEAVTGKLEFDLGRWDLPFVITWNAGGAVEAFGVASKEFAVISPQ